MWKTKFLPFLTIILVWIYDKIFNMERTLSQLSNLWSKVLLEIKEQLNEKTIYDSFFSNSYISTIENKTIYVVTNSGLAAQVITMRYLDLVNAVVEKITQTNFDDTEEIETELIPLDEIFKTPDNGNELIQNSVALLSILLAKNYLSEHGDLK